MISKASSATKADCVAEELAAGIQAGDRSAEEKLVECFGDGVSVMLGRHANDAADAADFYQETFRLAIEKLRRGELREHSKLAAFLVSIARNVAIEHYRKVRRRRTEPDTETVYRAPSQGVSQLDRLLHFERARLVRRVIRGLNTDRDREILFRFYIAEEDKDDIARDHGLTAIQFNKILYRARQRYKELYEQALLKMRRTVDAAKFGVLAILSISRLPRSPMGT